MMEEAHKESLAIKDGRIATLEQHLEDAKTLNATLHRQLDTMQKEYQSYMDRYVTLSHGLMATCVSRHVIVLSHCLLGCTDQLSLFIVISILIIIVHVYLSIMYHLLSPYL